MQTWKLSKFSLLFVFLLPAASFGAQEGSVSPHQAPPAIVEQAWQWNHKYFQGRSEESQLDPVPHQPVPEYAHYRYLLMTNSSGYDIFDFKQTITKNLPGDMKLVLLVSPGDESFAFRTYTQWIPQDRLIIVSADTTSSGFWARDAFPYPVYMDDEANVGLVSAQYFRDFEAGEIIANAVKAPIFKKSYVYVGGNLMADGDGRCFVVDSKRRFGLPEEAYKQNYGCRKVVFLKHLAGLGDVDEVVKVLPNHQALTNISDYVQILQAEGYQVTLLPKLEGYRTYANSVILNGTVFMPSYHVPTDELAAAVYRKFGYKVIMADSRTISDQGNGSFHCTTMTYPAIDESALIDQLHLKVWTPTPF